MAEEKKSLRGFASPNYPKSVKAEVHRKGGMASPGNFKFDRQRASEAGKKGGRRRSGSSVATAQATPVAAKRATPVRSQRIASSRSGRSVARAGER